METYKIIKFGIFDDFYHDFEKNTITYIHPLNFRELIVSTTKEILIIEKKNVKIRFPLHFSTFTVVPGTDLLIGITIKKGDINIYQLSDIFKAYQSKNSASIQNECLATQPTNQSGITHIYFSSKSNSIITIGTGIKVYTLHYELSDDTNVKTTVTITKRSSFAPNYTSNPMTPPAFDKDSELILLPAESGVYAYSLSGSKVCRCSKYPSSTKTIYATYPTKTSKNDKLNSNPSSNIDKKDQLISENKILTYDSNEGMNLWHNKGQLITHYDTIRSSVLSIIFIDSENAICFNSCHILFYLNIKTGKTFYYMNLEKNPSRLFLTYVKNEPILCACFGSYLRALKLVIPWCVWNLNLEQTLSIRRCDKFMSAARILIDAENSFVKLYTPRDGSQLTFTKTKDTVRPVSYLYNRGIVENYVYNSEKVMYETQIIKIENDGENKLTKDILYVALQNGQILGYDTNTSICEEAANMNCKIEFMTICRFHPFEEKNYNRNKPSQIDKDGFQWGYAVATDNGDLFILDYFSMSEIAHFTVLDDTLTQMSFNFENNCIVMVFLQRTILFDIEKGKIVDSVSIDGKCFTSLFGDILLYGYESGHIRRIGIDNCRFTMYNSENQIVAREKSDNNMLKPHSCQITGFSFAQKVWISSGLDGNVILWNYAFNILYKIHLPLPLRSCLVMNGKCDILVATATEIMQIKNRPLMKYLKKEDKIDLEVKEIDNYDKFLDVLCQSEDDGMNDESDNDDYEDYEYEQEKLFNLTSKYFNKKGNSNNNDDDDDDDVENEFVGSSMQSVSSPSSPSKAGMSSTSTPISSPSTGAAKKQNQMAETHKIPATDSSSQRTSSVKKDNERSKDPSKQKDNSKGESADQKKSRATAKPGSDSSTKNNSSTADKTSANSTDKSKSDSNSTDKAKTNSTDKNKASSSDKSKSDSSDKSKSSSTDKNKSSSADKSKSDSINKNKLDSTDKNKSSSADKSKSDSINKNKSDSTYKNKSDSINKNKSDSTDKSKSSSTDKSKSDSINKNKSDSTDKSKSNSTDKSKSDSINKSKTESSAKSKDKTNSDSSEKNTTSSTDKSKTTSDKSKANSTQKSTSEPEKSTKDSTEKSKPSSSTNKSNTKTKTDTNDSTKSSNKTENDTNDDSNDQKISKSNSNTKVQKDTSKSSVNDQNNDENKSKSSKTSKQSKSDKSGSTSKSNSDSKETSNSNSNDENNSATNSKDNSSSSSISKSNSGSNDTKISKSSSKDGKISQSSSRAKDESSSKENNIDKSNSKSDSINKSNSNITDTSSSKNDSTNNKESNSENENISNSFSETDSKSDSNQSSNKSSSEISNADSSNKNDQKIYDNKNNNENEETIENKSNKIKENNKTDQNDGGRNNESTEYNDKSESANNQLNDDSNQSSKNDKDDQENENELNKNSEDMQNDESNQNKDENNTDINDTKEENENSKDEVNNENIKNEEDQSNTEDNSNNNEINQDNQNNEANESISTNENANSMNENENESAVNNEASENEKEDQNNEINDNEHENANAIDQNEDESTKNDHSDQNKDTGQTNEVNNKNQNNKNDSSIEHGFEDNANENDEAKAVQSPTDDQQPPESPNENESERIENENFDDNNEEDKTNPTQAPTDEEADQQQQQEQEQEISPNDINDKENEDENENESDSENQISAYSGEVIRMPPPNVVIDKDELFKLYKNGRREFKPLVDEVKREERIYNTWRHNLSYVQNMTESITSYEEYRKRKESRKGLTLLPKQPQHAISARSPRARSSRSGNETFITANSKSISMSSRGNREEDEEKNATSPHQPSLPRIVNKLSYPASYVHNYNSNLDTQHAIATPRLFGRFSSIDNMVEAVETDGSKRYASTVLANTPKQKVQLPPLLLTQPIESEIESQSSTIRSPPPSSNTSPSPRRKINQEESVEVESS